MRFVLLSLFFTLSLCALSPVILVPGLGGSSLQAKLNKRDTASLTAPEQSTEPPSVSSDPWYCFKEWNSWFEIWLAFYELVANPCWLRHLRVEYDAATNTYANATGVQVAPYEFGSIKAVDYIDHVDDFFKWTSYFAPLSEALVQAGYEPGKNLFGAPYDWRLDGATLCYNGTFCNDLQNLVEHAYNVSGGEPVQLVTHSMGGPVTLLWLNNLSPEYKAKYIANFVPIAAPWSGTAKSLRGILSGDDFGIQLAGLPLLPVKETAALARQASGVNWLVPDPQFWPADQPFVTTPSKNYTVHQYGELFADAHAEPAGLIHERTTGYISNLKHPNVPVYCLYGYNQPTEIAYHYNQDLFNEGIEQPVEVDETDAGDGTVPILSLVECANWRSTPDHIVDLEVRCREYPMEHAGILSDKDLIADVVDIVTGKPFAGCEPVEALKGFADRRRVAVKQQEQAP